MTKKGGNSGNKSGPKLSKKAFKKQLYAKVPILRLGLLLNTLTNSTQQKPDVKKFEIEPGMSGILVMTLIHRTRESVRELDNLFAEYADRLYGPETSDAMDVDDDEAEGGSIEDAFAREMSDLKVVKEDTKNKRFLWLRIEAECLLFYKVNPPVDPTVLVNAIMSDLLATGVKKTRYSIRLIPIKGTARMNMEDITELTKKIVGPLFGDEEIPGLAVKKPFTWMATFKTRWAGNIKKEDIYKMLGGIVPEENKVDLDNPDVVIAYEAFQNVCGIAILENWRKYRKYNLDSIYTMRQKEEAELKERELKQREQKEPEEKRKRRAEEDEEEKRKKTRVEEEPEPEAEAEQKDGRPDGDQ
ncbi:hypothetical protein HK104_007061 [Borealophlyctis nickersoniae]|nr:hypothetical protein HK104_007061 [Borealophlyctis nickersoniae]